VLEHRWYLSEHAGFDVGMAESIESYVRDVLSSALNEHLTLPPLTTELPITRLDPDVDDGVTGEGTR
jgi:hypothetical protein